MASKRMAQILAGGFFALLLLPLFTRFPSSKANAEQPGWLSTQNPSVEIKQTYTDSNQIPLFKNGARCSAQKIITRPNRGFQGEISHNSCAVQTKYGAISQTGYLQRPGTSVWGGLSIRRPARQFIPIPKSKSALIYTRTTNSGSSASFVDDISNYIDSAATVTGEVIHVFDGYTTRSIKDSSGQSIVIKNTSLSFSANGLWMIVDVPNQGMARINVENGQVLVFGPAFPYGGGFSPGWQTAISADGRFAAISDTRHNTFRVYDLSTCSAPFGIVNDCEYKELDGFLNSSVSDYHSAGRLRFLNNDNLEILLRTSSDGQTLQHEAILTAAGTNNNTSFDYLGLGDSFASGEGAYSYKAFTDTDQNRCHLSLVSYPYLLSEQLGFNQYESIACSGAKQIDIVSGTETKYEDPQAKGKESDTYNTEINDLFLVGYRRQVSFLREYQPKTITLSVGGNDVGFSTVLLNCIAPGTCFPTKEDRTVLLDTIDGQFQNLVDTYQELKEASHDTRIYVLGYPKMTDPDGNCALNVHLNKKELLFANQLVGYINQVIKQATKKAGVFYVDIENAMDGKRLCETDSWNVAFNGLTAGDDKLFDLPFVNPVNGPIGNESYHPNHIGHSLYAKAINQKTSGLTAPMPNADPKHTLSISRDNLDILKVESRGQLYRRALYETAITNGGLLFSGPEFLISLGAEAVNLMPGSPVSVTLFSEPTSLGTFTTDQNGQLYVQTKIPGSVAPGWHTLHLYATNIIGEPVDIYKHVFVASSPEDLDGDGILNESDKCSLVEPSGQDYDQDGTDDACDGFIGLPPKPDSTAPVQNNQPNTSVVVQKPTSMTPGNVTTYGDNNTVSSTNDKPDVLPASFQHRTDNNPVLTPRVDTEHHQKDKEETEVQKGSVLAAESQPSNNNWPLATIFVVASILVMGSFAIIATQSNK